MIAKLGTVIRAGNIVWAPWCSLISSRSRADEDCSHLQTNSTVAAIVAALMFCRCRWEITAHGR